MLVNRSTYQVKWGKVQEVLELLRGARAVFPFAIKGRIYTAEFGRGT